MAVPTTIFAYKAAVRRAAEFAVYGSNYEGFPVTAGARTVSDYDTARLQFRAIEAAATPLDPTNEALDLLWLLRAGSKLVQCRTWPVRENVQDANVVWLEVATELVVHRVLIADYDANLYENDEMLDNQDSLLEHDRWNTIAGHTGFIAGAKPKINGEPARARNILSYTMNFRTIILPN